MATPSKQLLDFLDNAANKEDVAQLFHKLTEFLQGVKTSLESSAEADRGNVQAALQTLSEELLGAKNELLERQNGDKETMYSESRTILRLLDQRIDDLRQEIPAAVDLTPLQVQIAEFAARIPNLPEELGPEAIRDKLETLLGDSRLDKSAVKGIEEIEQEVKSISLRPSRIGGAKGIGLYIGGAKKLLTAQQINLIAGSGVSLTYAHANGRNDITISASGSGSFAVLPATGDVDDSNTTFTFASEPVLVIVNGASYRDGAGVSITGTTAELDNPVGNGGDIYGLG